MNASALDCPEATAGPKTEEATAFARLNASPFQEVALDSASEKEAPVEHQQAAAAAGESVGLPTQNLP